MSEKFEFKYTAPTAEERKEIDSIRSQYLPKNEKLSNLEKLRKLDAKVKSIPICVALTMGVVGILMFGVCMTFFLEWMEFWYIGVPFGIVGLLMVSFAYYVYNKLFKKYKSKYGEEIIKLSNELLNEESN